MSYQALLSRVVDRNVPFSVLLELTHRCNLDCFVCYNDRASTGTPLSLEQYLALFQELRTLGTLHLTFSGGEPLVHPQFFALGAAGRAQGFLVRIKTNGHRLSTRLARRLREEVDPFVLEISLHGASPATHDRQTRVAGSFRRLMANLSGLRALGLRLQLNATLTTWNEGEQEAMCDLAERLGIALRWNTQVTPRDDGDAAPLAIAPSPEAVARLGTLLANRSAEGDGRGKGEGADAPAPWEKYCGSGSSGFTVDPWGNLYPCVQWRIPAGSLHRQSVREIWEGSGTLRMVRERTGALARAVKVQGPGVLGRFHCPALAEQAADIQGPLPVHFLGMGPRAQGAATAAGS
jgi:MoaA/NifB/PqqE/SkfB family radical SAM enzyme